MTLAYSCWSKKISIDGNPRHGGNHEATLTIFEINRILNALNIFGTKDAIPIVEETKYLWSPEGLKRKDIIEECDRCLKKFSEE